MHIFDHLRRAVKPGAFALTGLLVLSSYSAQSSLSAFEVQPDESIRIQAAASVPFAPGERLEFDLRWTAIPAGQAVLEVMPMKVVNGQLAYHFRLTAETQGFVDSFYKVRDRIDAFAAADMSGALHYSKKQREGRHRRDVRVEFDQSNATAQYEDGKRKKKPIEIQPGTFDPLSVFYYSRTREFRENGVIESMVSDGKKCVQGVARIVKREEISVPGGTFDTFLIEPDLKHIGGVFEKDKGARIQLWVTADERRIPVKIASKVAIGSFVGELRAIENGSI